jgi:hypothetical protein
MARWGLGSGCPLGVLAAVAAGAAVTGPSATDGAAWCAFAAFAWGAIMSVYSFDRPAPADAPRT